MFSSNKKWSVSLTCSEFICVTVNQQGALRFLTVTAVECEPTQWTSGLPAEASCHMNKTVSLFSLYFGLFSLFLPNIQTNNTTRTQMNSHVTFSLMETQCKLTTELLSLSTDSNYFLHYPIKDFISNWLRRREKCHVQYVFLHTHLIVDQLPNRRLLPRRQCRRIVRQHFWMKASGDLKASEDLTNRDQTCELQFTDESVKKVWERGGESESLTFDLCNVSLQALPRHLQFISLTE